MRLLVACLMFVVVNVALAPNSRDLHTRFGEPNLERFTARDGIAVSVEYGRDGAACAVLIEPPPPLGRAQDKAPLMLSDTVAQILQEIAPVESRGLPINSQISSMGCAESTQTDYLDMTVERQKNVCTSPKPEHEVRALLTYKRDICRALAKVQ